MYVHKRPSLRGGAATLLLLMCLGLFAQTARAVVVQKFYTSNGIVLLSYAPQTPALIQNKAGGQVWKGVLTNTVVTRIPLPAGNYQLKTPDEISFISRDLASYVAPSSTVATQNMIARSKLRRASLKPRSLAPVFTVLAVPWVGDATFSADPPNAQSRHVIFSNVPTTLKAVIYGGSGSYSVQWDPYSNGSPMTPVLTNDAYNGAAQLMTYPDAPGTLIKATVTVTDTNTSAQASANYYLIVGQPGIRANRVARATDEGLWYLHTQLQRIDQFTNNNEAAVDVAYLVAYFGYSQVAPTSMFAICLENTGHSVTGGVNLSNSPTTDPYVEDLNRLINYLTDSTILLSDNIGVGTIKTYNTVGDVTPDTHGPGGIPNGIVLYSAGYANYEGGMQLQAISQAGNVNAPVPNRSEYNSYYDLVGDFVDGFQYSQAPAYSSEGGWRYGFNDGDSDGSAVAWVAIGLRAAEFANTLTPGAHQPPIVAPAWLKTELGVWLMYDQSESPAYVNNIVDYRARAGNDGVTQRSFSLVGGFGYTAPDQYGILSNAGKTGGGLMALKYIGTPESASAVMQAEGFLYRLFWAPDYNSGWSSSRDSYGMYNMFKGLKEAGVDQLTDATGSGGNDLDGIPLAPFDWYGTLVDFISGTSDTDLGHSSWPGNSTLDGVVFSASLDGHFETTGTRSTAILPFNQGEWGNGASDGNAGEILVTAWDVALMQGAVFTPGPVAVIGHPDTNANETYIPVTLNNQPYSANFDPGHSYELDPSARIIHATWDFGDGSQDAVMDYDLPVQGLIGGAVAINTGLYPAGNVVQHHYSAEGTYTVKLTVKDDKGDSNATTLLVHVIHAPYPPIAQLTITPVGSKSNGDTFGYLADGSVTLMLDGTGSYNIEPTDVLAPKNGNGISSFMWEWPVTLDGQSEAPALFDEGTLANDPNLANTSKAGLQTYKFQFTPGNVPSAITIGLKIQSNIVQVNGQPPDTSILFRTIRLLPNNQIPSPPAQIKNLSIFNITDTTANISFDTVDANSASLSSASVAYGLTNTYGTTLSDNVIAAHHLLFITGLTPKTKYHYQVTAMAEAAVPTVTADMLFSTLNSGVPILQITSTAHAYNAGAHTTNVTYKVTNTGTGDAVNFALSSITANKGVSYSAVVGTVPSTVPAGGSATFTLQFITPATPPANFASSFKAAYQKSVPVANYSKSVTILVPIP